MRATASFVAVLSSLLLAVAQETPKAGVTGALGDAAIVKDNPIALTYTATLPNSTTSNIRGSISATASTNGTGVQFTVKLSGLPDPSLGPFLYHIHDQPVPANGSCKATLAHLDPYQRGEHPPCDPTQPQTCQVGDLGGKHGNITTSPFNVQYLDLYASTKSGIGAFFGNRSIVIHTSNTTRLTCANFALVSSSSSSNGSTTAAGPGTSSVATPVGPSASKPAATTYTGAAAHSTSTSSGSVLALIGGLVVAAMLL
ncbi:MAG: hypothetical protein M1826_005345 [Phylliscum demangeonii]|nr:MAG: hypothetical protein M1826_005345 [Phylliscum demangeonii]